MAPFALIRRGSRDLGARRWPPPGPLDADCPNFCTGRKPRPVATRTPPKCNARDAGKPRHRRVSVENRPFLTRDRPVRFFSDRED